MRRELFATLGRPGVARMALAMGLMSVGAMGCSSNGTMMTSASTPSDSMAMKASDSMATHKSQPFTGVKANTGYVTHGHDSSGRQILTLSDDFKVPETPAPHWQVVDAEGNVYLLQRLVAKGDKYNKTITLPEYVRDVKSVQIWCAYAEVLLGEAPFDHPVK